MFSKQYKPFAPYEAVSFGKMNQWNRSAALLMAVAGAQCGPKNGGAPEPPAGVSTLSADDSIAANAVTDVSKLQVSVAAFKRDLASTMGTGFVDTVAGRTTQVTFRDVGQPPAANALGSPVRPADVIFSDSCGRPLIQFATGTDGQISDAWSHSARRYDVRLLATALARAYHAYRPLFEGVAPPITSANEAVETLAASMSSEDCPIGGAAAPVYELPVPFPLDDLLNWSAHDPTLIQRADYPATPEHPVAVSIETAPLSNGGSSGLCYLQAIRQPVFTFSTAAGHAVDFLRNTNAEPELEACAARINATAGAPMMGTFFPGAMTSYLLGQQQLAEILAARAAENARYTPELSILRASPSLTLGVDLASAPELQIRPGEYANGRVTSGQTTNIMVADLYSGAMFGLLDEGLASCATFGYLHAYTDIVGAVDKVRSVHRDRCGEQEGNTTTSYLLLGAPALDNARANYGIVGVYDRFHVNLAREVTLRLGRAPTTYAATAPMQVRIDPSKAKNPLSMTDVSTNSIEAGIELKLHQELIESRIAK